MTLLALLCSVMAVARWPAGPARPPGARRGQGIVEYGIILGLSALLALVILVVFGSQVADIVQWIGRTVDQTTGRP